MGKVLGTKQVAELLGVPPTRLQQHIWNGRLPEPPRGPGGAFIWGDEDIRRAARLVGRTLPAEGEVERG